jgi:hypothetical protein
MPFPKDGVDSDAQLQCIRYLFGRIGSALQITGVKVIKGMAGMLQ